MMVGCGSSVCCCVKMERQERWRQRLSLDASQLLRFIFIYLFTSSYQAFIFSKVVVKFYEVLNVQV